MSFSVGLSSTETAPVVYPLTIKDSFGVKVRIDKKPVKIVSCALFIDEVLLAVADKRNVFAVSRFALDEEISNVADDAKEIGNALVFNVETLVTIGPDLLLIADWTSKEGVAQLRKAGITVFQCSFPATFDSIMNLIGTLSRIVGEPVNGSRIVTSMSEKLDNLASRLSAIKTGDRKTVLDYNPVYGSSFGQGTLWDEIVRCSGLVNAARSLASDSMGNVLLSREKIIELDPDIIILPAWSYESDVSPKVMRSRFIDDPVFKGLAAVKHGRVFQIPEKYRYSGSHHTVEGVEALASLAYPYIFK